MITAGTVDASRSWIALVLIGAVFVLIPYAYRLDERYKVKQSMKKVFFLEEAEQKQKLPRKGSLKDLVRSSSFHTAKQAAGFMSGIGFDAGKDIADIEIDWNIVEGDEKLLGDENFGETNYAKARLFLEVARKVNPLTSSMFPDLHYGCVTKAVFLGICVLASLWLNAFFYQAEGVSADPRCADLGDYLVVDVAVGILSGILSALLVWPFRKLLDKPTEYVEKDQVKEQTVLKWQRREMLAQVFGVVLCSMAAVYLFAFTVTVPPSAHTEFLVASAASLGELLLLKPILKAAAVVVLFSSGERGKRWFAHLFSKSTVDFSHLRLMDQKDQACVTQADRVRVQRGKQPSNAETALEEFKVEKHGSKSSVTTAGSALSADSVPDLEQPERQRSRSFREEPKRDAPDASVHSSSPRAGVLFSGGADLLTSSFIREREIDADAPPGRRRKPSTVSTHVIPVTGAEEVDGGGNRAVVEEVVCAPCSEDASCFASRLCLEEPATRGDWSGTPRDPSLPMA